MRAFIRSDLCVLLACAAVVALWAVWFCTVCR